MKNLIYRSIQVLAMLSVAFAVVTKPVSASAPAPDKQTARYEIRFMEKMIDHHTMAVMMAEMCTMKAVHPELIATCENIITSQSEQIDMLQTWLQDWYGITYEPKMMSGEMQGHMQRDPAQFEVWFMKRMISHHAAAIREAEDCLQNVYHSELKGLCQNIIAAQSQEIDMMQTWLCDWYGVCNYRKNL